ncbi:hypothetical protein R9X47_16550 [Wukongibacter baidiensis]|uniref:hypothetical protein n=1 Tax=Wukongibacter baidiensis TaxID=1723361 RepID=UPI003D7FE053
MKRRLKGKVWIYILIIAIIAISINFRTDSNEEPDFVESFLAYEDDMENANQEDPMTRELLERFKPRIFIAKGSYIPMNFYNDYLPNTTLKKSGKIDKTISDEVSRDKLFEISKSSEFYLDYGVDYKKALEFNENDVDPTVYGRIYRSSIGEGEDSIKLLFLKYNLVYPYSGLPEKTSSIKKLGSKIIGNPLAWHELDIHGAVHIVLREDDLTPLGVILAQHNHHRVYLTDRDFDWPEDSRVEIAISKYSNEPYLAFGGERNERVIGNPMKIEYLFGVSDKQPLTGGMDYIPDIKDGAVEVECRLELLPLDDPLYTSAMGLGDRKKLAGFYRLWYLDGPPGIDYYTMPQLKSMDDLMVFWYIDPEDNEFFTLYNEDIKSFTEFEVDNILEYQKRRFLNLIKNP